MTWQGREAARTWGYVVPLGGTVADHCYLRATVEAHSLGEAVALVQLRLDASYGRGRFQVYGEGDAIGVMLVSEMLPL